MPRNLFEHEMSDLKGSLVDLGHLIDTIIADTCLLYTSDAADEL